MSSTSPQRRFLTCPQSLNQCMPDLALAMGIKQIEPRRVAEQRGGQGPGDDGEAGVGYLVLQPLDQAGGQHRVADAGGRDE